MNVILSKDGKICHVIKDCIKQGNDFIGSNKKLYGAKHFDITWTEEEVKEDTELSKVKISKSKTERKVINQKEYVKSIEIISKLDSMSFPELKEHINTSINDLASAKEVILLLAETIKACIEIQNYDLKKGK